jgi:2-dehydro-3-deoxyphosphogluconate aldolase/(4S)-4-hydroxy-2-oxoglutarate aldolase
MNHDELAARIRQIAVMPIVVPNSVAQTLQQIEALAEGGARGIEIVLRTPIALDALHAGIRRFPEILFGAGTVLSAAQFDDAVAAGAAFTIAPGLDPDLVAHAASRGVPMLPGVQTASEVMAARRLGVRLLKFYPAEAAGGTAVLEDFARVFPDVAFMPSGKITFELLPRYARLSNVASVGGTWMLAGGAEPAEISDRMRSSLDTVRGGVSPHS